MDASLMTRMKELEEENRRLRKMYVEEQLKRTVHNAAKQPFDMGQADCLVDLNRGQWSPLGTRETS